MMGLDLEQLAIQPNLGLVIAAVAERARQGAVHTHVVRIELAHDPLGCGYV